MINNRAVALLPIHAMSNADVLHEQVTLHLLKNLQQQAQLPCLPT
jgi:hypothetical protein